MTQEEKKEFVLALSDSVLRSVLEALPRTPEDWDGHELRQLLADRFAASTYRMTLRRKRDYENTVMVQNLD